jgi:hypothetical protein
MSAADVHEPSETTNRCGVARVVLAFSGRPRESIELDTRATELLAVIDQTMQPAARVSVWLRPAAQVGPIAAAAPRAAPAVNQFQGQPARPGRGRLTVGREVDP